MIEFFDWPCETSFDGYWGFPVRVQISENL